jgi:hypothetical protein
MKSFVLIAFIALTLSVSGQNLSKNQAQEDLKFLYKSIENVHPELYWYYPKHSAEIYFSNMLNNLEDSLSTEKLYVIASEFITKFNSSHLGVKLPLLTLGDFSKSTSLNPLPLELDFNSKGIYVKGDITGNSPVNIGDQILSINGNNSQFIFTEFQKLNSNVRNFDVWKGYSKFFMEYYRLQFGDTSKFNFKYVSHHSKDTLNTTLNSISKDQWGEYFMANYSKEVYSYKVVDSLRTGIIKILSFADSDISGFNEFLENTFNQIKTSGIKNLIVDIRGNGGGNTMHVDSLLSYIISKPYQYEKYIVGKVSQERRNELLSYAKGATQEQIKELLDKYNLNWTFDNEVGDTVLFLSEDLMHYPKKKINKFEGNLYLLIDEEVGSTSQLFTQAFKCNNLGTIVGQETGEATIFFGDNCSMQLPNSKLQFVAATKKFISHCEPNRYKGITPDYDVDFNPSKLLNGEDEVLDFVFNLIEK